MNVVMLKAFGLSPSNNEVADSTSSPNTTTLAGTRYKLFLYTDDLEAAAKEAPTNSSVGQATGSGSGENGDVGRAAVSLDTALGLQLW